MFRYNNKTYRIDGIAWDHTPSNTFKRGDADTSFKNYYKSVGIVHSTLKKKKKSPQVLITWTITGKGKYKKWN